MTEPHGEVVPEELARTVRAHLESIAVAGDGDLSGDAPVALARPNETVEAFGAVLSRLHRSPIPHRLEELLPRRSPAALLESARSCVEEGRVRAEALSGAYRHMAPEQLLAVLDAGVDSVEEHEPVIVHGAPTLDRLSGARRLEFLRDWRRAALADPHLDLAVATTDVANRLGPGVVPVLAAAYEPPRIDPQRLDWYLLAVELAVAAPARTA